MKKNSLYVSMYVSGSKVKGQKNMNTKSQQKLDESYSKVNKTSMSHDQRSKEHRWVIVKGQKNINTESPKTL
jgi:hypothetical protein